MREPGTLLHRLRFWAEDQPQMAALHYKDEQGFWCEVTASQYWRQVVRFALALRDFGVNPGDRVLLYAQNSPEWVQWELALWLSGAISVGVHPQSTDGDLQSILIQSCPCLILVESEPYAARIEHARTSGCEILTFAHALERMLGLNRFTIEELDLRGVSLLSRVDGAQTQAIVFTSGSTGTPKGVMIGLNQLTFVAETLSREWRLPYMQGDLFSFLPLAHVAEKVQTLAVAILQRYPVWFNSGVDDFFSELREVKPTLLLAVPRVWERIRERVESQRPRILYRLMQFERIGKVAERLYLNQVRDSLGLGRLRFAVSGAAKLPPGLGEWFSRIGIEIQEIYGMSETTGLITLTHPVRSSFRTVGTPPGEIEVRVSLDGEIQVRGPNVFNGYWGNPADTEEVLSPEGWLKTGDLGEWSPDLHIIGRNREIIKLSNGRMIAPLPIENALKEIPEVSNVCVVGEGRPYLLALITLNEKCLEDLRFRPGAIEGLVVEDPALRTRFQGQIRALSASGKISDPSLKFILLARDFSADQKELTQTQKLNRNQIQKAYRHFIDLQFER